MPTTFEATVVKINVNGRELDATISTRVEVRVNGFRHVGEGLTEDEAVRDFEAKVAPIMGAKPKGLHIAGDIIEHPKSAQRPPLVMNIAQRFGAHD